MSKKPRTKKRYHPRAVAVPPYLASLDTYDNGIDHRDEDVSSFCKLPTAR